MLTNALKSRLLFALFSSVLLIPAISHAFGIRELYPFRSGPIPRSPLLQTEDGAFYGASNVGGDYGLGFIFRCSADGTVTVMSSFDGTNGMYPNPGLICASDGALYGTTTSGGDFGSGCIFRLSTNGTMTLLASFAQTNGDGPVAGVIQAKDGYLYGTTASGGDCNLGTVYRCSTNGVLSSMFSFCGTNGSNPWAALIQARNGLLYGTTYFGGTSNNGTVFQLTPNGDFTMLASLDGTNGANIQSALVEGTNDVLYGITTRWGQDTVFSVTTNGALTTFVSFDLDHSPVGGLMLATNGMFYFTVNSAEDWGSFGKIVQLSTDGVMTDIAFFPTNSGVFPDPSGNLIQGQDGALYSTTDAGGLYNFGSVFRLDNGALTTIASFAPKSNTFSVYAPPALVKASDGGFYGITFANDGYGLDKMLRLSLEGSLTPVASLQGINGALGLPMVQAGDGNFYGSLMDGGPEGDGLIFRVTTNGQWTTLYTFTNAFGGQPSSLAVGPDGALYGTTESAPIDSLAQGTVFRIDTTGSFKTIVLFTNVDGGTGPFAPLLLTSNSVFWGTTSYGGASQLGTVFSIGTNNDIIPFASFNDVTGGFVQASLTEGPDGAFYGMTTQGDLYGNGVIFRASPGQIQVLAAFGGTNGSGPHGNLVVGGDGALYGATGFGGAYGLGTIFRITPSGVMTTLVNCDLVHGALPISLVLGGDGQIYGTTFVGGSHQGGTFFRLDLSPQLQLPVKTTNGWRLTFNGLPGDAYRILRSNTPNGPWTSIGQVTVGTDTVGTLNDSGAPAAGAFYKVAFP